MRTSVKPSVNTDLNCKEENDQIKPFLHEIPEVKENILNVLTTYFMLGWISLNWKTYLSWRNIWRKEKKYLDDLKEEQNSIFIMRNNSMASIFCNTT